MFIYPLLLMGALLLRNVREPFSRKAGRRKIAVSRYVRRSFNGALGLWRVECSMALRLFSRVGVRALVRC